MKVVKNYIQNNVFFYNLTMVLSIVNDCPIHCSLLIMTIMAESRVCGYYYWLCLDYTQS